MIRIASLLVSLIVASFAFSASAAAQLGAPQVGSASIELIDQGDEPRRALRYKVAAGAEGDVLLISNFGMNIMVNGQDQSPQPIPGQRLKMGLRVSEIADDGDIHFGMIVEEAGAEESEEFEPSIRDVITDAMAPLEGAEVKGRVSERGMTRSVVLEDAPEGDQQTAQMLADLEQIATQIGTPFPEESVGVGARWSVTRELSVGAFAISEKTIFELLSIEDNRVRLALRVDQSAEEQPISSPTLPPEADARLSEYTGTGEGEAVVDLERMAPIDSDLETSSSWTVRVAMGQVQQAIQYSMTMSIHMEAMDEQ